MGSTDVSLNERLALHELIRIGFGRGEDLQLLQSVVTQEPAPLPPASYQLLRECQLREEWRCLNEAKLLAQVEATNLISINDTARMELAAKVQQALQQQLRARSTTQQQHGAHATAKFHPRKTGTASSAPPSPQVTARGLGAIPRPKSALTPSRPTLTPTKAPTSPAHGKQLLTPQQLRSQLGAKVLSPTSPSVRARHPHSLARPTQPQSQSTHHQPHHHQQQQSPAHTTATHPQCQTASVPASASCSQKQAQGGSHGDATSSISSSNTPASTGRSPGSNTNSSRTNTSAATGALVQEPPPLPHFHRSIPRLNSSWPRSYMKQQQQQQQEQGRDRLGSPLVQPKPRPHSACQPSQLQPARSGGRFEMFLRLQGSLLEGLQQHASSGGAKSALQALQQSVGHMQAHFQACLLQAGEALGVPLQQQQQQQQQGLTVQPLGECWGLWDFRKWMPGETFAIKGNVSCTGSACSDQELLASS
uniref:Uncharacterized protein n=1 Tax=Dunaliella tertiolecta TaxID=3047 RepID=A0A6S8ND85_DUNTE